MKSFPERFDAADWGADDQGVLRGRIDFKSSEEDLYLGVRYDFDASLSLLSCLDHQDEFDEDAYVALSAEDDSDRASSIHIELSAAEADRLAEQLQLAAKLARDGEGADVRT